MSTSTANAAADRLGVTFLFSLIAHAVVALGITFTIEKPAASLPSLEKDARAANATAVTAVASGDAFLSYGEAAKAEALYQIALGKPGVDQGRALTRLGIAQTDQGKYAEAQATFAKITGPRKPIADLWSAYAASKAKPAA